ncbi:MAG: plasmid segregation actin-type ATPase ParM, partial [Lachnospiraceae bacterium]|nr:plasmid segregation actin-type ATPase ParM [Lachnospiraceae bacterium]
MMRGQEIVVDIGSWTIDIMRVVDRVPDQATIATDPNGIITCMKKIQEVCVAETNSKIDEYMIREFITKGDVRLDQEYVDIMVREFTRYTEGIFRNLAERGINVRTTPITFVGGGAVLMKKYAGIEQKNISYVEDVKANAIGYETLASLYLGAQHKREA